MIEKINVLEECAEEYKFKEELNGNANIYIKIPPRFKDLCLDKIFNLKASENEIFETKIKTNVNKIFNLSRDCVDQINIEFLKDNYIKLRVKVPRKYAFIWACKLTDLTTTMKEIEEYDYV